MSGWSTHSHLRESPRIAIIGGGPAGSSAAIRLSQLGYATTLFEKSVFPREKVCGCCLGAAGLAALRAIGVDQQVARSGSPTREFVWYLQTGQAAPRLPIRIPIRPGVALHRGRLDALLLETAHRCGVEIQQPCEALVASCGDHDVTVAIRSSEPVARKSATPNRRTETFELVILATGLTGRILESGDSTGMTDHPTDRLQLPWKESPHGPLGVSMIAPATSELASSWPIIEGEIQMLCNDSGYLGVVRLPGGDIDFAAAIHDASGGRLHDRLTALATALPGLPCRLTECWKRWLQSDARLLTAPNLRRQRQDAFGRVAAIGDCAGYVEPMTGEGMTWGIESGLAVADTWHAWYQNQRNADISQPGSRDFSRHWTQKRFQLQRKRRLLCGMLTSSIRGRVSRRCIRAGLGAMPFLAAPITRALAVGPPFCSTIGGEALPFTSTSS